MAAIPLPDKGQPLDISYLITMATEINKMNSIVNANRVLSSILYGGTGSNAGAVDVPTSDLVFYGAKQSVKFEQGEVSFYGKGFSFKNIPVVTVSVETSNKAVGIFAMVTAVSTTSCTVKLFSTGTPTQGQNVTVSIIALGQK